MIKDAADWKVEIGGNSRSRNKNNKILKVITIS